MPSLYHIAKSYVEIIENMERTSDKERLIVLEEKRAIWHNKLIEALHKNGITFKDRDDVTQMAYRILRDYD